MTSQLTARASVSLMHVSCFQTSRQAYYYNGVGSSMLARIFTKSVVTGSILTVNNRFFVLFL